VKLPVARAIERLGALQAQWSPSPYVALWTRLDDFAISQLERALLGRRVVKATLMRSTLHIVSARDYAVYAAALVDARRARVERSFPGASLDDVADRLRQATAEPARTWDQWRLLVVSMAGRTIRPGEIWPLWMCGFMHARLVHVPPSGMYGHYRSGSFVPADEWIGPEEGHEDPMRHLVRRYLAAFGPASADDARSWLGVPGPAVRPWLEAVGTRRFRDEAGRLLYDLPRAPLPPPDTTAPVRFLPKWDSSLLAYAPPERGRILPERYRKRVIAPNGDVAQTFLVDGYVAGTWAVEKGRLRLEPFERRVPKDVREEGERLLSFLPQTSTRPT
jgi:hypothetical protein